MRTTRRNFLLKAGTAVGAVFLPAGSALGQQKQVSRLNRDELVLLGTRGGPLVGGYLQSPSANLLLYKGAPYVIDAGYGVTFKLIEAGVDLPRLQNIFITHHHSDHNLELGPLLYNSWAAGLRMAVNVYGPAGLNALLAGYWASNRYDLETRIADEGRPDLRKLVLAHEYSSGPLLSAGAVKVSALRNLHPPVKESYSLRFELENKTVVFSGDTAFFPALAEFAKGADYLIHEVMYGPAVDALVARRPNAQSLKASILSHHTLAEDVGRIASQANVKTVVLNHFVPGDDRTLTPRMWSDAVAKTFSGRIVVGSDMLRLPL